MDIDFVVFSCFWDLLLLLPQAGSFDHMEWCDQHRQYCEYFIYASFLQLCEKLICTWSCSRGDRLTDRSCQGRRRQNLISMIPVRLFWYRFIRCWIFTVLHSCLEMCLLFALWRLLEQMHCALDCVMLFVQRDPTFVRVEPLGKKVPCISFS